MKVYYFNITYRCNSNCIFCAADHPLLNDDSEMSVVEFENILKKYEVNENDRVVINGGEPTIHRKFWDILDLIKKRKAKIDLFTNGKNFYNESFTKRILTYDNLHIRIPLFGHDAQSHNKLTGGKENFQITTKGLDILCQNLYGKTTFEIKLLLSKITVKENEKIYDLIKSRWNHKNLSISLNPLLISRCVIQQKDIFLDTYESMMKKSESFIRRAINDKINFSTALIPYCSFPNFELMKMCRDNHSRGSFLYSAPKCSKKVNNLDGRDSCLQCLYFNECNGFPKNYIAYFGKNEIKPIKQREF